MKAHIYTALKDLEQDRRLERIVWSKLPAEESDRGWHGMKGAILEAFNAHAFTLTLALVGIVIVVAALLSGFIERSGVPQVAVFLALGATLGPYGLGLMNLTLDAPLLRVVATLSLALVLFTDAVGLDIQEMKKQSGLALLVLGPGTMLSAAFISLLCWQLLGLPLAGAIVLGAALASTDPVLLPRSS